MTYAKLFGFGLLLALVLVVLKTIFFGWFTWSETSILHLIYWGAGFVLTPALVRRLGVITILEAIIVMILWLILQVIADVIIAIPIVGWRVMIDGYFAVGYLVPPAAIFLFHKKRHVHRRKELSK